LSRSLQRIEGGVADPLLYIYTYIFDIRPTSWVDIRPPVCISVFI